MLLRALFVLILVSMLLVTTWASLQCPLFGVPADVFKHPWFIATMFDAYWGFVTFFVWVCFREQNWGSRGTWFVAIMLLGNIAMSCYCLALLRGVTRETKLAEILVRQRAKFDPLGGVLAAIGIVVTVLAIPR